MPTAPLTKFGALIDELSRGGHNLQTAVLKAALTNTAPSVADTVWSAATYPPPAAAHHHQRRDLGRRVYPGAG
jgi:hypothetical protein